VHLRRETAARIRPAPERYGTTHPTAKSRRTKAQEAQVRVEAEDDDQDDLLVDLAAEDED
jgi:hypothetical protein